MRYFVLIWGAGREIVSADRIEHNVWAWPSTNKEGRIIEISPRLLNYLKKENIIYMYGTYGEGEQYILWNFSK